MAYAIVGWLLVQIADTFFPTLQLPEWTVTLVAGLVILGFPIALILSWAYELTPEGMKRSHEIEATESITHVTGRKLDFAIIGALVLALGFVVYNYVLEDGSDMATGVLPNSVAVLPFENMSVDPEEAFYASGIHEEILNQLVKLSALNVIARTSVLQYEDTDKSIPEIARELNVETVMEGSVRYAAGQIRITAQLNDGITGAHLWSETYTRDFDDIFAIESDVAMNVANAIGAEFSLAEQASIEKIPTDSSAAYALYLRASSIYSEDFTASGVTRNRSRWEPLLLDAIDLDSDFGLAYVELALLYATMFEEVLTLEYAHKALEVDPALGSAYGAMAYMYSHTGRFDEAVEVSEQGLQRSPANPSVLLWYGISLVSAGQAEEGLRVLDRVLELDPASGLTFFVVGWSRWNAGDRDGALVAMRRAVELDPETFTGHRALSMMEATLGNRAEAEAQVRLAERLAANPELMTAYAYRLVGLHDDAVRVAEAWAETNEEFSPEFLSFYYHLVLDEEQQALDALVRLIENPGVLGNPTVVAMTNAFDDPTLEKPEFAALRAEFGAKVGWN